MREIEQLPPLTEVDNRNMSGLTLTRKIDQGIFIKRFGLIRVTDIGFRFLHLSIQGIGNAEVQLPTPDTLIKWGSLYKFENTELYLRPIRCCVYRCKIFISAPNDIQIFREEMMARWIRNQAQSANVPV